MTDASRRQPMCDSSEGIGFTLTDNTTKPQNRDVPWRCSRNLVTERRVANVKRACSQAETPSPNPMQQLPRWNKQTGKTWYGTTLDATKIPPTGIDQVDPRFHYLARVNFVYQFETFSHFSDQKGRYRTVSLQRFCSLHDSVEESCQDSLVTPN